MNISSNALIVGPTQVRLNGVDMSNLCPQQNLRRVCGSLFAHFCHWLPAGGGRALAETQQPFFSRHERPYCFGRLRCLERHEGHTGQLVSLGFSAHHAGISVWVLTQQIISIPKPFCENVAAIVLQLAEQSFTHPSGTVVSTASVQRK